MLKAVAFDAFGTLVDIFDKRRPYLAVAKAGQQIPTISPLAPRITLEQYARLCGAPWRDAWSADLAAELASIAPYSETVDVLAAVRS